jgi:hypothetical protein
MHISKNWKPLKSRKSARVTVETMCRWMHLMSLRIIQQNSSQNALGPLILVLRLILRMFVPAYQKNES